MDYSINSVEVCLRFGEIYILNVYLIPFIKIHFGLLKDLNVKIIVPLGKKRYLKFSFNRKKMLVNTFYKHVRRDSS